MKRILLIAILFMNLIAHSQNEQFASTDDALFYLEENFVSTTAVKEGKYWIDPIMLEFEEGGALYLHLAKGKILEKDYVESKENEMSKLKVELEYLMRIYWDEIEDITIQQDKSNDWWLTIKGKVYDMDDKVVANSTRLYIINGAQANKIKAALNYLRD
jgi:hypothetical protein